MTRLTIDSADNLAKAYAPGLRPHGIEIDIGTDCGAVYLRFRHVATDTPYLFHCEEQVLAFASGLLVGMRIAA